MRTGRMMATAAIVVALVAPTAPAEARTDEATAVSLAFEGTADMAAGTWSGVFTGQMSGSHVQADGTRIPWTLILANPAQAQLATVDILGCAAGTVTGRFRIKTDDGGQALGFWVTQPVFPRYIVAVDATFDFQWHRAAGAGPLVVTEAVVDVQLYHEGWSGFDSPGGWVRVVDSGDAHALAGTARLESADPAACAEGLLKGEVAGTAAHA